MNALADGWSHRPFLREGAFSRRRPCRGPWPGNPSSTWNPRNRRSAGRLGLRGWRGKWALRTATSMRTAPREAGQNFGADVGLCGTARTHACPTGTAVRPLPRGLPAQPIPVAAGPHTSPPPSPHQEPASAVRTAGGAYLVEAPQKAMPQRPHGRGRRLGTSISTLTQSWMSQAAASWCLARPRGAHCQFCLRHTRGNLAHADPCADDTAPLGAP